MFAHSLSVATALAIALSSLPALAHDGAPDDARGAPLPPVPADMSTRMAAGPDPQAREAWLADCRRNQSRRDDGMGGAVIGGLLGGVIGNRVAGRHHRTVGTVAGAAVGAVAGAVIDKSEDNGRVRDWCESYLDDYYARAGQGYGYPAYGYAYAMPVMMVPASMAMRMVPAPAPGRQQECREEVTYEYVDVPVRERRIQRRPIPDKRLRTYGKRVPL